MKSDKKSLATLVAELFETRDKEISHYKLNANLFNYNGVFSDKDDIFKEYRTNPIKLKSRKNQTASKKE